MQILDDLGWGGTQALIALFAKHAHDNLVDLDVVVLGSAKETPYAAQIAAHGASVRHLSARKVLDPARLLRLRRHILDRRPDIIHCHLRAANTIGPLAARLTGTPALGGLHVEPLQAGNGRRLLRRWAEIWSLRRWSRAAIACCDSVATAWRPLLAPLPVHRLTNPAPRPDSSRIDRAALAGLVGAAQDDMLLAVVGRLAPEKGVDVLLRSLAVLGPAPFRLAVIGDGPERGALEAAARGAGLAGRVVFLGARVDAAALCAAADVYVSASLSEGLSIAMLEAMAAGRPVIATDVGDARSVLDPAASLLVAPGDAQGLAEALRLVVCDAARLQALTAAAARAAGATRAPAAWAAELATLYRAIAPGDGHAPHSPAEIIHA
jgi:glycosyltransferase involved in cell wall biosynthesis